MKGRRIGIGALAVAGAIGLAAAGYGAAGFQLNTSASAPKGLWRVSAIERQQIERGSLVSMCPPEVQLVATMRERGFLRVGDCSGVDTTPLLKPVVAVAGDVVRISREGVSVNGRALPRSAVEQGMPGYPAGAYKVRTGHVWLISSYNAGSFDSRYFGPVSLANLRGRAVPIFVRGDLSRMTAAPERLRGTPISFGESCATIRADTRRYAIMRDCARSYATQMTGIAA